MLQNIKSSVVAEIIEVVAEITSAMCNDEHDIL